MILPFNEEKKVAKWVKECGQCSFGKACNMVYEVVKQILQAGNTINLIFDEKQPGKTW